MDSGVCIRGGNAEVKELNQELRNTLIVFSHNNIEHAVYYYTVMSFNDIHGY